MTVDIVELDLQADREEWDRYVERSPDTNPFYRAESLIAQADQTDTAVHALAGFKGEEPVGLFPVFAYRRGPFTAVFSPAPQSWVIYLGPALLNVAAPKQRKTERRIRAFIEGCLEWVDDELSPLYTRVVTGEYEDVRPFTWHGCDVTPRYTYVVPLDGSESELLDRFSSDARNNITNADDTDADYHVTEGGATDVERIVRQVRDRYEQQDKAFHMDPGFARGLYETLPDGCIRPYVCRVNDSFAGGILVVESGDTRYRWQGGVKPDTDADVPVNDLLDWHVMRDGLTDGRSRYDLVGASVPSINEYKAKFNPELEVHYEITSGSYGLDLLIEQYRKLH